VPTPDGGAIIVESTPIPSTKITQQETPVPYQVVSDGKAVAKDENRTRKIVVRVLSGALMIGIFLSCLYMGHVYICFLVAFVELLLFRELVKVRYSAFFDTIQDTIPLFRTTQWMWFAVAIFYTYGDFFLEIIKSNQDLHYMVKWMQYSPSVAFMLYSATFVLTIATMQVGHIKFQLNQLCWTIVVLCLTVGNLKYIMHNIFNGLIWFALPILLVVTNDIMAYVVGMTCGRKFIHRPFISFSPNKTWEGFIGGGIFTLIGGWYLARLLAQFTWLTCATNEFRLFPEPLTCQLDPIFLPSQNIFPPQMFEILPRTIIKMIPNIVEICMVDGNPDDLTNCVSGNQSHSHHHFELVLKNVYPVQIHALSLAFFASVVAPFGGFLASAIKRAYGLKDFDSIIPGHGGVMDRMDCQFLMALCTWVHYNTFVKMANVSVPKILYLYNLLSPAEQVEFLETITGETKRRVQTIVDRGLVKMER
jgi:phosphatidate cytidylyltransferase